MGRREQIRLAAITAISQSSFSETTIQTIAKTAGLSVGSIYNYFKSKEEVLDHIFVTEYAHKVNLLQTLIAEKTPVRHRFEVFLRQHFADLQENPALTKLLIQEYRFPEHQSPSIKEYTSQLPALINQLLGLDNDTNHLMATMVFGALQALSIRYILSHETFDTETAINKMSSLFVM